MQVRRVVETCLYVADVEASAAWYERVLGLAPFGGTPPRDRFLRAGDTLLLLFDPERSTEPSDGPPHVPAHGARGVQHVALAVDDVEPWRSHLAEQDVDVTAEASFGSGHSLYFEDPDGHVIELVSQGTWPVW